MPRMTSPPRDILTPSPPTDDQALRREQMLRLEAQTLNSVALDLSAELDLQTLVQKATDAGTRLTGAQFGAFFYNMVDDRGEAYQLYTLSGAPREAFEKLGMPRNTPVFAPTFNGEGAVRVDDITRDARYGKTAPHHGMPGGHLPVRSYLAVPVVSRRGEVLGGLFFGHPGVGVFSERSERYARGIAAQAAIAIDNARLYAQACRENEGRARVETALRESERQLNHLVALMPAAMYACDIDGRITYYNRQAVELWGREPNRDDDRERFCACHRVWLADGTPLPPDQTPMAQAVRDGVRTRLAEAVVERPDGTRFTAIVNVDPIHDEQGRRIGAINVFQDITEHKRAEQAHAHLAAIIASSGDAIISKTLDGVVTSWNAAAQRIFGYTADEAVGRSVTMLIPPNRFNEETDILARISRGERVEHFETVRIAKDGRHLDISLTVSPVRDGTGQIIGASKIARDVTERKRADAALHDSERRLRMALAAGGMGTWEWVINTNQVAWSPSLEAIHGRAPGSFKGTFDDVLADIHPDDRDRLIRTVRRAVDHGEEYRIEYRILTPQDGERWLEARGTLIRDGHDRPPRMTGICMDVTARKHAQEEIDRLNQRLHDRVRELQALLDVLPVGVFIAQDPDCRVITANRAGTRMLRLPDDANASKTAPDDAPLPFSVFRDGRPVADADLPMQRCARTGRPVDGEEYDVTFDDGTTTNLYEFVTPLRDERGAVRGCVGAFVDITDRKRAEAALRESEQRFRVMANHAPVMVWVAEADGARTFLSTSWCEFTGQTEASGLGLGWLNVLHPDDREHAQRVFASACDKRKPFRVEYRLRRRDGVYRWALDAAAPRFAADGRCVGYIGSVIDITERKAAEQQLRRAKHELELRVAERTAELRALTHELTQTERRERKRLAQVLHDEVQQLLAAVKMQADFALLRPGKPEPIERVKQLTDDAIAACRSLTVGLSPPVLRDTDLAAALHWLARHMQDQHGLKVRVFAHDSNTELQEDLRVLLFEITRELLFNVVKHAGVDEAAVSCDYHEDGNVCIEVADEGRGCAPDALNRPGRDSFGLFSIRERIGGMGGRIETETTPRRGVRVRVTVPVLASHPGPPDFDAAAAPLPEDDPSPRTGTLHVLLADDHQILRQGLAELLATQPDILVVAQANDGLEAVELARQHAPDVVVMDITMPRMTGVEATRMIRAEMPQVRVIGLSMHEHRDMAAAMRDAGAETFLNKAGPVERLLNALRGDAADDKMRSDD